MGLFKDKFKYAIRGLYLGCKDISVGIQLFLSALACLAGIFLSFSLTKWCILLLCIGLVLVSELCNSVIERIMDFIHPDQHEKVKDIKDMAAGFVLLASIVAFSVGCILVVTSLLS